MHLGRAHLLVAAAGVAMIAACGSDSELPGTTQPPPAPPTTPPEPPPTPPPLPPPPPASSGRCHIESTLPALGTGGCAHLSVSEVSCVDEGEDTVIHWTVAGGPRVRETVPEIPTISSSSNGEVHAQSRARPATTTTYQLRAFGTACLNIPEEYATAQVTVIVD